MKIKDCFIVIALTASFIIPSMSVKAATYRQARAAYNQQYNNNPQYNQQAPVNQRYAANQVQGQEQYQEEEQVSGKGKHGWHCKWVGGFWKNGHYYKGHKVCWKTKHGCKWVGGWWHHGHHHGGHKVCW